MKFSEALELFVSVVPSEQDAHMLCWFASEAKAGRIYPFTAGLLNALTVVEDAAPGYAHEMLKRIASVPGTGEEQYEALLQSCAEVYVTRGAAERADADKDGKLLFGHEPGDGGQKNPELECCAGGVWFAVEAKTPKLIAFRRKQSEDSVQLLARLPYTPEKTKVTLPRDNPVKDFLTSSEAKFTVYAKRRPDAFRILTVVWDDYVNEPISALLSPMSGLLTAQSFFKDASRAPVSFSYVDAVVICRYQHQIQRATRTQPLLEGETMPLQYRRDGFPFKAFVPVPGGRKLPDSLLDVLNAVPLHPMLGAEYMPSELVMWQ